MLTAVARNPVNRRQVGVYGWRQTMEEADWSARISRSRHYPDAFSAAPVLMANPGAAVRRMFTDKVYVTLPINRDGTVERLMQ
jgi:hypothetical protein